MTRISWERLAALAGLAFVVLYVAAFALGIEVGDSDREILAYYANSGHRTKEIFAFFLIAGAALALVIFASALRSLIARGDPPRRRRLAGGPSLRSASSLARLGGIPGGRAADARDRVPRLPRLRRLAAHRQRRPRIPPLACDSGASRCHAVSICVCPPA